MYYSPATSASHVGTAGVSHDAQLLKYSINSMEHRKGKGHTPPHAPFSSIADAEGHSLSSFCLPSRKSTTPFPVEIFFNTPTHSTSQKGGEEGKEKQSWSAGPRDFFCNPGVCNMWVLFLGPPISRSTSQETPNTCKPLQTPLPHTVQHKTTSSSGFSFQASVCSFTFPKPRPSYSGHILR